MYLYRVVNYDSGSYNTYSPQIDAQLYTLSTPLYIQLYYNMYIIDW